MTAFLGLTLLATPASATVGGDSWIELLGWEPVDQKVYLLEHYGDESGRPPRLSYYDLDSAQPTRHILVTSWYGEASSEHLLHGRLEALRSRLKPLEAKALDGLSVHEHHVATEPCEGSLPEDELRCRVVDVQMDWDGLGARFQTRSWGSSGVQGAWSLPGTDAVLVLYSHIGHTYETGYQQGLPVLLSGPSEPPPAWEATCAPDGPCTLAASGRELVRAGRGDWSCAEDGQRWLACVWTHTNGAFQRGWFVDLEAIEAHPFPLYGWGSGAVVEGAPVWDGKRVRLHYREPVPEDDGWRVRPSPGHETDPPKQAGD